MYGYVFFLHITIFGKISGVCEYGGGGMIEIIFIFLLDSVCFSDYTVYDDYKGEVMENKIVDPEAIAKKAIEFFKSELSISRSDAIMKAIKEMGLYDEVVYSDVIAIRDSWESLAATMLSEQR